MAVLRIALALVLCSVAAHGTGPGSGARAGARGASGGAEAAPAQRLQMVACDGARALNLSAASLAKGHPGMLRSGQQSCVAIHT